MLGHSLTLAKLLLHRCTYNCSSLSSASCIALWSAKIHLSYSTAAPPHAYVPSVEYFTCTTTTQHVPYVLPQTVEWGLLPLFANVPTLQRLLLSSASDWLILVLAGGLFGCLAAWLLGCLPNPAFTAAKSVKLAIFIGKLTIFTRTHISCDLFSST